MKAILTVLFFLMLMASSAASWMDSLVDSQHTALALKQGLEERRRDWGRLQRRIEKRTHTAAVANQDKLPLGPLFSAQSAELDGELLWQAALLGRLCLICYPNSQFTEAEVQKGLRDMFSHLAESRKGHGAARADHWDGFSGIIAGNEDLLAIPLAPGLRDFWLVALTGAPPAQGAVLDWIDVSSYERARLEQLQPPVRVAIFGTQGAASMIAMKPELREAALSNWLDANAVSAARKLIDWSANPASAVTHDPAISLAP
jgi:hypothetical protein